MSLRHNLYILQTITSTDTQDKI